MKPLAALALALPLLAAAPTPAPPPLRIAGLDHVNIAVGDLEAAARRYRALGFTLKDGQPHANGIENRHTKFTDGTEIELITAPTARDALTTTYRRLLAEGDGGAFLALHASGSTAGANRGIPYLFFGALNHSPTDRPEHFVHRNSAMSLAGVWIAADDVIAERALLRAANATIRAADVWVPDRMRAAVATVGGDEIVFLPAARQVIRGRKIVGVTVTVGSLTAAADALRGGGVQVPAVTSTDAGQSLFIPPDVAHGVWLEFRQPR